MFDDFRQQADKGQFEEQPAAGEQSEAAEPGQAGRPTYLLRRRSARILGMTGPQRFVIAVMVLFEVCLLGSMFLLVTQKIVPAFFY